MHITPKDNLYRDPWKLMILISICDLEQQRAHKSAVHSEISDSEGKDYDYKWKM